MALGGTPKSETAKHAMSRVWKGVISPPSGVNVGGFTPWSKWWFRRHAKSQVLTNLRVSYHRGLMK